MSLDWNFKVYHYLCKFCWKKLFIQSWFYNKNFKSKKVDLGEWKYSGISLSNNSCFGFDFQLFLVTTCLVDMQLTISVLWPIKGKPEYLFVCVLSGPNVVELVAQMPVMCWGTVLIPTACPCCICGPWSWMSWFIYTIKWLGKES